MTVTSPTLPWPSHWHQLRNTLNAHFYPMKNKGFWAMPSSGWRESYRWQYLDQLSMSWPQHFHDCSWVLPYWGWSLIWSPSMFSPGRSLSTPSIRNGLISYQNKFWQWQYFYLKASISIYNSCRKEVPLDQLLIALAVFDLLYLLLAFLDSLGKKVSHKLILKLDFTNPYWPQDKCSSCTLRSVSACPTGTNSSHPTSSTPARWK